MTEEAAFGVGKSQGQRKAQEDYVTCTEDLLDKTGSRPILTVVADGMGGHTAGEVASKLASTEFVLSYRRQFPGSDGILRDALIWANDQVADHVNRDPSVDGMGCTLVALEIDADSSAYRWISVGDSLLLSVTPDSIARLNADHSYREERRKLQEAGESLAGAPSSNALRSAIMGSHIPLIDDHSAWRAFAPGERLVIATDGLETLDLDEVAEIVRANGDAVKAADALIAAVEAAAKPRQDNTTVAVIHGPIGGSSIANRIAPPPITRMAAPKKQTPPQLLLGIGAAAGILVGASALLGLQTLGSKGSDPGTPVHVATVKPAVAPIVALAPVASSSPKHDTAAVRPPAPKPVATTPKLKGNGEETALRCILDKPASPPAPSVEESDKKHPLSIAPTDTSSPSPSTSSNSGSAAQPAAPTSPAKAAVDTFVSAKNGACPRGSHPAPAERSKN